MAKVPSSQRVKHHSMNDILRYMDTTDVIKNKQKLVVGWGSGWNE